MGDEPRQQPVAIRVTRPYPSAEEFLEHELETLTRTSITLVGAQSRPKGVILRFEVALSGGVQLLRGEGRVVGYKDNALGDQPGLVLRFTRLDTKSKALVDRAAATREARARAALQAAMGEESVPPPSVPPSMGPDSLGPIGPMSVMQEPPSFREPSAAPAPHAPSSPPRPAPLPAPHAFFHRQEPEAETAPPFDESTFSPFSEDPPTGAEPPVGPSLYDTSGSMPPARPGALTAPVTSAVGPEPEAVAAFATHVSSVRAEAHASETPSYEASPVVKLISAPPPPPPPPPPPSDTAREPALDRLRARAKDLSSDRLNALIGRRP